MEDEKRSLATIERTFFQLGVFIANHAIVVIAAVYLVFVGLSFGFFNAELETDVDKLWIEKGFKFRPRSPTHSSHHCCVTRWSRV